MEIKVSCIDMYPNRLSCTLDLNTILLNPNSKLSQAKTEVRAKIIAQAKDKVNAKGKAKLRPRVGLVRFHK